MSKTFFHNINKSNYFFAVLWFILHIIIELSNNIIIKKLNITVPNSQIMFLSFLFSTLTLFPFMIYYKNFKTRYILLHIIRGFLLFTGVTVKYICLQYLPIIIITLVGFFSPISFLLLASLFLNEKITNKILLVSLIGFLGVIITLNPVNIDFNPLTILILVSGILLSCLDILNKKYVNQESILNMVFYLSLFTTLFSLLILLYIGWVSITFKQMILCAISGIGVNLLSFSLLKAFALADATSLLPLRYASLPISLLLGYLIFSETLHKSSCFGAAIIILSNIFLMH